MKKMMGMMLTMFLLTGCARSLDDMINDMAAHPENARVSHDANGNTYIN